jgi:hypothetical protein
MLALDVAILIVLILDPHTQFWQPPREILCAARVALVLILSLVVSVGVVNASAKRTDTRLMVIINPTSLLGHPLPAEFGGRSAAGQRDFFLSREGCAKCHSPYLSWLRSHLDNSPR